MKTHFVNEKQIEKSLLANLYIWQFASILERGVLQQIEILNNLNEKRSLFTILQEHPQLKGFEE